MKKREYIINWFNKKGDVTTWHLNDDFLEYLAYFYPSFDAKNIDRARATINYHCRKLSKIYPDKIFKDNGGTGLGGKTDFGCNMQYGWVLNRGACMPIGELYEWEFQIPNHKS